MLKIKWCMPTMFKAFIFLLALAMQAAMGSPIAAQTMPEGTIGWTGPAPAGYSYHATPDAACRAFWEDPEHMHGPASRFIGAVVDPGGGTASCLWTTYQYLCPAETGLGIGSCGTILPRPTFLECAGGYDRFAGRCVKAPEATPARPINNCPFNPKANNPQLNVSAGNPAVLVSGEKRISAQDFQTVDGLFGISRSYNSMPIGRGKPEYFLAPSRGMVGGWTFDFAHELQLSQFAGTPSNPNAHISLITPEGAMYSFYLAASGEWLADASFVGTAYASTDLKLEFIGTLPSDLGTIPASSSTWRLTDGDDTVWTFQTFKRPNSPAYVIGRPTQRKLRGGYTSTFVYRADTSLQSMTDSFGRAATFAWANRYITFLTGPDYPQPYPDLVTSILLPDGNTLKYAYDAPPLTAPPINATEIDAQHPTIRLAKVEMLDIAGSPADSTTYLHENAVFPQYVTKIVDHGGKTTAVYEYDARGRVSSNAGGDGSDKYSIEYAAYEFEITRKVTNPLGKKALYTFKRFDDFSPIDLRLIKVDGEASPNCPASMREITYGSGGNVFIASTKDDEGRITTSTRDAKGRPLVVTEAVGTADERATTYTWHPTLNVPSAIAAPGLTTSYSYTSGNLTAITKTDKTTHTTPYATNGRTETWAYNWSSTGLLNYVDGPLAGTGDRVSFTYTPSGYLDTTTDQLEHVTTVVSRNGRGEPLTVEDSNGVQTVMTYDPVGRPLTIKVDPGATQSLTTMEYDPTGNLKKLTLPGGGWTSYDYDDAGRITKTSNNRGETEALVLNGFGSPTSVTVKNAASVVTRSQTQEFDELGRLMRSIGAGAQTWAYAYDKVDNLMQTTDARGKLWKSGWDALDRVITETDPQDAQVKYAYAANDGLREFRDGRDITTTRIIDGFGLTIFEHSPDRGDRTYWYDKADRLTKVVDQTGTASEFTYDASGRRLTESYSGGGTATEAVGYSYDATASGNKGIGRLTGASAPSSASSFVYDAQGRVTREDKVIAGNNYALLYGYDSNGEVTSITYPSGHIVTYGRASDGKIVSVSAKPSAGGTSTTLASGIAFAPFGPLTALNFGNGLSLSQTYDQNYWQTGLSVSGFGVSRLGLTFARDANGNLTAVTDTLSSGRAASYSYTDAERLQSSSGAWGANAFGYDAAGNRTQVETISGGSSYAEVATIASDSNRVTKLRATGASLATDPFYTLGTNYDYIYGGRKRMLGLRKDGVDQASYLYDSEGRRVSTSLLTGTPSTTHYIFGTDGRVLAEHNGATGALLREYVWLDDMPLAIITGSVSNPSYYYMHIGQIGEPLMVTNGARTKLWDAAVDPWGKPVMLSTATLPLNLRLPGQWAQGEAGIFQNWMRDYDPLLGRYAQSDPLGIEAGDNVYAYVENNPINRIDPMGLCPMCLVIPAVCAGGGCEALGALGLGALWWATHPFDLRKSPYDPPRSPPRNPAGPSCPSNDGGDQCEIAHENDDDTCRQEWKDLSTRGMAVCFKTSFARYSECLSRGGRPEASTTLLYLPYGRRRKFGR